MLSMSITKIHDTTMRRIPHVPDLRTFLKKFQQAILSILVYRQFERKSY